MRIADAVAQVAAQAAKIAKQAAERAEKAQAAAFKQTMQKAKQTATKPVAQQTTQKTAAEPITQDIAAGRSIDQIAKDRGMPRDQVIAQLQAAGYEITTTATTDTRKTEIRDPATGKVFTENYDFHYGTYYTEVKGGGANPVSSPIRDESGRKVTTSRDEKTGAITTRYEADLGDGTVIERTRLPDGTTVERTKPKAGPETEVTRQPDGSVIKKTSHDGRPHTEVTGPDGKTTVLDPAIQSASRQGTEPIVKAITDGKGIDQIAEERGLTPDQVIAQLRAGGYQVTTTTTTDTRKTEIRDPASGRVVTENHDYHYGTYYTEVKGPDGKPISSPIRDESGRKVTTSRDETTGAITTRYEDDLGDGTVIERTRLPDGTTVETTTRDGKTTRVVTMPDGTKTELSADQEPTRKGAQPIVQDLAQGKSIDQIAKDRGLTREQVLAQLAASGLTVRTSQPEAEASKTEVIDKRTGKVIASHSQHYLHGTESTHYVDAQGNDITRTVGSDGTVVEKTVAPNGHTTEKVTQDGKTTTSVTHNGYTLTTAPDGSKTLTDTTNGKVLKIKPGSVEESLANVLFDVDPKSSDPAKAKEGQIVKTFLDGIFAGKQLPDLIEAAEKAGTDKQQLIDKYGLGQPATPKRDDKNNIIDPIGDPPAGNAPSGGKWVPVQIDGSWRWVDPEVAKAIARENTALALVGEAQAKIRRGQTQLDVYALDPAYKDAMGQARTRINDALAPHDLQWVPQKPKGTLAEAQSRLTDADRLFQQASGARGEYQAAESTLGTAIDQWGRLLPLQDTSKTSVGPTNGPNWTVENPRRLAAQADVKALFAQSDLHKSKGDGLTLDYLIGLSGASPKPPEGMQPVDITVGGRTVKVSPEVAEKYKTAGGEALLDSDKPIGIEIEITKPDGSKSKEWRWVDPQLAVLKLQSDRQLQLSEGYNTFYDAYSRAAGAEAQSQDLQQKLLAEYNDKHQFLFEPDKEHRRVSGDYLGKFQGQRLEIRDGQLWVVNQFEDGTTEQQLTYGLNEKNVRDDYRDRPLNQQWQSLLNGSDPNLCSVDGLQNVKGAAAQAGRDLTDLLSKQLGADVADLDKRLVQLRSDYGTALTQYGPGSVDVPKGTLPEGAKPVEMTVGGTKIKVAPEVAEQLRTVGLDALTESGKAVWIELDINSQDGNDRKEGRWVDPRLAVLQIRTNAAQLERTAKSELDGMFRGFRDWYDLKLSEPQLLVDANPTTDKTYLDKQEKLALDGIYQPQFQSMLANDKDNLYTEHKPLSGAQLNEIVTRNLGFDTSTPEGREAVKKVTDEIGEIGGDAPKVRLVPIFYVDNSVGSQQTTLFAVQDSGGKTWYVDATGRKFGDLKEFQDNNAQFAESGKLVVPVGLSMKPGSDGRIALDVVKARNVSTTEKIIDPLIGIGTGVATVLSFTPAAPIAAPLAFSGGAYFAGRAIYKQARYIDTGGEWGDTESLMNMGMFATSVLPMGASGLRWVGMSRNLNITKSQAFLASIGAVRTRGAVNAASWESGSTRLWHAFPHTRQVGGYLQGAGGLNRAAYAFDAGAMATGTPLMGYSAYNLAVHGDEMSGLQIADAITGLTTGFAGTGAGARNLFLYAKGDRTETIRLRDQDGERVNATTLGEPPLSPDKIFIPPKDRTAWRADDPALADRTHILVRDPETGEAVVLPWVRGGSPDHVPAARSGDQGDGGGGPRVPVTAADRVVDLAPFTADDAGVLTLLEGQLRFSPDFQRLGADGMTRKWLEEIGEGTRMAYVIYPARGSSLPREPLGIISLHKEPLIGDSYLTTLSDGVYGAKEVQGEINRLRDGETRKGEDPHSLPKGLLADPNYAPARRLKPAGEMSGEELASLGDVWQFSTYLITERTSGRSQDWPFASGVVNRAAKMKTMALAAEAALRRGEPIPAFYARVHAGGAFPVSSDGVVQLAVSPEGNARIVSDDDVVVADPDAEARYLRNPPATKLNGPSLGSQQSQGGRGPIAVILEEGSPYAGQPHRYVAIFETGPDHYLSTDEGGNIVLDGPGAQKWLGGIQQALEAEGSHRWAAAEQPLPVRQEGDEASPAAPAPTQFRIVSDPWRASSPYFSLPGRIEPAQFTYTSGKDPDSRPLHYRLDTADESGKPVKFTEQKFFDRYQQEKEYYTPRELAERYGPEGLQPPKEKLPDYRIGLTFRERLNTGDGFGFGDVPIGSPTLRSRSVGIGLRSSLPDIGTAAQFSVEQRSTAPLRGELKKQLSLANRPDEWRQTTAAQWGILPGSNWTIFPVFGNKLIDRAKGTFFGEPDPGWTVNVHSPARLLGVTPENTAHVVEIDFSPQLVAKETRLTDGEMDFFGGTAEQAPNGHVTLLSDIPSDRVMQDIRLAPYLPGVTALLNHYLHTKGVPTIDVGGETITFTPGGERRSQVMLSDSLGKGDVVPRELTEQFNAAASGSTIRLQVAVRTPEGSAPPELEAFIQNPTVEKVRELAEKGYIDPDEALFFVPPHGHNFHQTAIPGKPLTKTITDLTGRTYEVPDEGTSNLWMIFNDRWALPGGVRVSPERAAASGFYKVKQWVRGHMPGEGPRRTTSPHHLPGEGNILDGFFGPDRQLAHPSYRFTAVLGLPYLRWGPVAYNAEIRLQRGTEAPEVAPAVRKGETMPYRGVPDGSVQVPTWFVGVVNQVLSGPTPVIPKGGTKQIDAFLTQLADVGPEHSEAVAQFRARFMSGPKPVLADLRFLRRDDAKGMVELLPGLRENGGESGEGGATQEGPRSLSAAYHRAPPPSGEEPPAFGLPEWARLQSDAFRPYDTVIMHRAAAGMDMQALETSLTAAGVSPETARRVVVQLGDGVEHGSELTPTDFTPALIKWPAGWPQTRPVSATQGGPDAAGRPDPIAVLDRAVDLVPFNENTASTVLPLLSRQLQISPDYRDLGPQGMSQKWEREIAEGSRYAFVIYPAQGSSLPREPLGIIAVHKEPLIHLDPDGANVHALSDREYAARERSGATNALRESNPRQLAQELLADPNYAPPRRLKPAGEMTVEELAGLGPVWQFSTYLVGERTSGKSSDWPFASGVVNRAAKMKLMAYASQREVEKGNPVPAFYARVHAGGGYPVGEDGVQVVAVPSQNPRKPYDMRLVSAGDTFEVRRLADGTSQVILNGEPVPALAPADEAKYLETPGAVTLNGASLGSQQSQSGQGPIAIIGEKGSPYPDQDTRYVAIFETRPGHFLRTDDDGNVVFDGPGTQEWLWGKKGVHVAVLGDTDQKWAAPADIRPAHQEGDPPLPAEDPGALQASSPTLPQRVRGYPFPEVGKRVDPAFSAKLVDHIRSQGGIPFADYMNLALYGIDGEGGYYNSGIVKIGDLSTSDFITAPEFSKYFGRTLAGTLHHMYDAMGRPARFDVVEMGAGNGVLARDILDKLRSDYPEFYQAVHYVIVERSQALLGRQQANLANHPQVEWVHASADSLPLRNIRGVFLSNELVDAFPVHRAVMRRGDFKEVYVTVDERGRLVETERDPSPELAAVLPEFTGLYPPSSLREGDHLTVNARAVHWMRGLGRALDEGYVLTIDYGEIAATQSTPPYVKYGAHSLPADYAYKYPGAIDITSHVDFMVLSQVGEQVGLGQARSIGGRWLYTQTDFLRKYGLREALQAETDPAEKAFGNELFHRFSDGFHVLVQEKRGPGGDGGREPVPQPRDGAEPQAVPVTHRPDDTAVSEPRADLTPAEQQARRREGLQAFLDGNLTYPADTRHDVPIVPVRVKDGGTRFSAFGKDMTPHEFLLTDKLYLDWFYKGVRRPAVLDIVNPSPEAVALAQRLANLSGSDVIVPRADAPTEWQVLRPVYDQQHPTGRVELDGDELVLVQGDSRRTIRPEEHLGQMVGIGATKTAFRLYDKTIVVFREPEPDLAHLTDDVDAQIDATHLLIERGAPFVAPIRWTQVSGRDAFLMDSYQTGDRSIATSYMMPGNIQSYVATDVGLLNENSLSSLRQMRDFYSRENLGVNDAQFLIAEDGSFYLHDFTKVYDFADADPYAYLDDPSLPQSNRGFIRTLDHWIGFVEKVIERRQNPQAPQSV